MATNPNPFLRSPLDTLADDLNREAETLRAKIPKVPEPGPEPAPEVQAPAPQPAARKKTGKVDDLLPPPELTDLFNATAEAYEVPVNVLMALAHQESRYQADAVGVETKWGKAKGMMQNLDATARGLKIDAMNPNEAVPAAAYQIRQRLDKGMSMEDAVMEHFAGPDRKQWGEKTAQYGREVMEKVSQIGKHLVGPSFGLPVGKPVPVPGSKESNRMSPAMNRDDYLNTFVANNPQADGDDIKMAMAQFDADNAQRGSPVEDRFARMADPNATFDAKLDAKLAARQKNRVVPPPSVAPDAPVQGPTDAPSLTNDFQRGLRNLQALAYGAAGMGADAMGMDAKAEKLLKDYVEITENNLRDNPAAIGSYKNIEDLGDAGRYAVEAVLENVAMIIPSLVTGGVGAAAARKAAEKVVGGMVQKQVAQGIARKVAEQNALKFIAKRVTMGATAGAAASSVAMEAGSIMGDIYAETGQMRAGTAAVGGIAAGLLDTIAPVMALRKIAGPVVDEAAGHVLSRLGAEVGKQFLVEAGTEGLQTLIEKASVRSVDGKVLFNAQLADELIDATLKGGIGGAVMGGASQAVAEVRAPTPARMAPLPAEAAPLPASDSPLASSLSESASPAARVVVATPQGQAATGTVTDYAENESGQFNAEVVGDDGQVYQITEADGLTLVPVAPEAGPLTSALEGVAAAEPVVAESSQLPATGAEPTLAPTMENADAVSPIAKGGIVPELASTPVESGTPVNADEPGIAQPVAGTADASAPPALTAPAEPQAVADMSVDQLRERMRYIAGVAKANGASKMTVSARREVEAEINRRAKALPQGAANGSTDPVRNGDVGNGSANGNVRGRGADGIGSDANPAMLDEPGPGAEGAALDGAGGAAVPGRAADQKQTLKIPKEGFGTAELAKAFRKKAKLDASHDVVQTGRVRWEVRAKGDAAPNSKWREKEDAKAAKLEAALATANANASARKAEKAATGYNLPDDVNGEWRSSQRPDFKPSARQQLLMDAVKAEQEAGTFYSNDMTENVAKRIGVSPEIRASNKTGVEGGDFGYDVYLAQKAVEAGTVRTARTRMQAEMNLSVGDKLGTMVFNDFKQNTGVEVVSVEDGQYTLRGKRGATTVEMTTDVFGIKSGLERAKEKGKRKDGYDDFVAARMAKPAAEKVPEVAPKTAKKPKAKKQAEEVKFSVKGSPLLADLRQQWADAGIKNAVFEKYGTISVSQIVVPDGQRNAGKGTKFMQELVAYADRTGQRITLSPSADFGGNKARLVKFYKRFGFIENKGRSRDFTIRESMFREPTPVQVAQPEPRTATAITATAQFKEWFNGSKVVDSDGKPLEVYHGTSAAPFDTFQVPAFFTEDREGATWYVDDESDSSRVESAFLVIKNPIDLTTAKGQKQLVKIARAAGIEIETEDDGTFSYSPDIEDHSDYDGSNVFDLAYIPAVRDALLAKGYDGLRGDDLLEAGEIPIWIALKPDQIRIGEADAKFSVNSDDYRDEHRPPSREDGAPLSDLTGAGTIYPADVYSTNGPRYYGTGNDAMDKQAFRIASMAKGKPDFDVMIFRAVPSGVDAEIDAGDWVTINRAYAEQHGEARFDGDYKILSKMVKASDIFTNGDSIQEWGYDPADGEAKFSTGDEDSIPEKIRPLADLISGKPFDAAKRHIVAQVGSVGRGEKFDDDVADAVFLRLQRNAQVGRYTDIADIAYRKPKRLEGDGEVTLYRAAPKGGGLRPGDFMAGTKNEAGYYKHGANVVQSFKVARRDVVAVEGSSGGGQEYVYLPDGYKVGEVAEYFGSFREFFDAVNSPDKGTRKSVGTKPGALTSATLRKAINTGTLGPVVDSMVESGLIVLHDTTATLPKGIRNVPKQVQALTAPDGKVHLIASNLTPQNARAVMLHEAFHQGGEKLIGSTEWVSLMKRMASLFAQGKEASKGGKANQFYSKARARVASAREQGAVEPQFEAEEFAAYAIEEYESAPKTVQKWVDDLLGMVKAWLLKRFGAQMGDVTPAQLSAIAKLAMMDVAVAKRGEMFGPAGELFSTQEDRRTRTIEIDGVRRPITNSKGRLVAQDFIGQMKFWNWFKNSAVTVGNAPRVVYHGTNVDFDAFKADKTGSSWDAGKLGKGFYFSTDPKLAGSYANNARAKTRDDAPQVMPVYLSIQNPLEIGPLDWRNGENLWAKLRDFSEQAGIDIDPVSDPASNQPNPEWSEPFRDALKRYGYDGVLLKFSDGNMELVAFDPEQIKSATGNTTFDPANPDIRYSVAAADAPAGDDVEADTGLTPPEQGLLRRVQASIQDQMNRVKQVQEKIEQVTGTTLPERMDYYLAETNRPGRIAARLEDGENDLFTPLMERLAKAGHTPVQLEELLHAMHASERNETVARINPDTASGSGMDDDKAAALLKKYEGDEFKTLHKLADDARAIARHTLDLKLAYGLLTPERHEQLTTHYEFYVPLKGDGEYGVKVKQAMGHDTRDEFIVENILRDFKQAVVAGEKNMARQVLLHMILKNPDEKLWSVGIPPKGRYIAGKVYEVFKGKTKVASFDSASAVAAFMEGKKGEAVQYRVLDSAGMQVAEFTKQLQDNEVMVYLKGESVRVQIYDEALAKQLRPLDRGQMSWFWEQSQKLNRYYSRIYTGYNPAFILRNAARDAMTGTINMMGNYGSVTAAKAWAKYPQALAVLGYWATTGKIPKGATGDMLRAYRDHGGKVGASHMGDLEAQGVALQRIYEDAKGALSYAGEGKIPKAAWIATRKAIRKLARVVEIANQATENALRLALFMEMRAQGESNAKAAQAAKTVTVDFDRKGASTAALSAAYLFFNPAIQGSANGIKTLAKGKHRMQAWGAMGGLAVLGYWLASKGMDEDKDRWLGEKWDIRTKNLIINGKEHQIRVPMSQEFAPFFAFGHALAEVSRGEKASSVSVRMVSAVLDAYIPLRGAYDPDSDNHGADLLLALVPSIGQMPAQLAMNRNSFGSQIVPENDFTENRPDNLKMNRATKNSAYDKAAQKIAAGGVELGLAGRYENDITKVSPETLKLLWANFTGGLGTFVADTVGVAAMAPDPDIDLTIGEIPIAKDFVRNQSVKPLRSRYFELTKEARTAIDEFKEAKKAGDGEAIDAILADEGKMEALALDKMMKADSKAAKEMRELAVDINADTTLTPGQKRARLKELEQEEEALYRDAIKAFQE